MLGHQFCSKQDWWFSVELTNGTNAVEIVDAIGNDSEEVVLLPVTEMFSERILKPAPEAFHNGIIMGHTSS